MSNLKGFGYNPMLFISPDVIRGYTGKRVKMELTNGSIIFAFIHLVTPTLPPNPNATVYYLDLNSSSDVIALGTEFIMQVTTV
ncbi:hypothetical protein [Bacillus cereus]|uniref:hypothetical protein n=1 Tax=Bacillus cereus TaxID=1396 RepID=UPI000BFA97FB|nr:hypothetical protein [Bacillus cereus]PFQ29135.1 hypothetical protein COK16_07415 [Bacillus cereus]PGR80518.1 hypothetical protein COC63_12540 [Bacillus cereus]